MSKRVTKFLAFVMSVVMLIAVFSVASFAATSEEVDTHLQFNANGEFKILQIADMQDGWPMKGATKKLIRGSIERENPDLIVLTGDNINKSAGVSTVKAPLAINEFMSILEEYGIPVVATFGNHDTEGDITRAQQIAMYEKYDCFIGCTGVDFGNSTSGTYYVPLYSSDDANKMVFNLWVIDSGDYNRENDLGGYAAVTKEQINWYVETEKALAKANGGNVVPSIVFQHIALPEVYNVLKVVPEGTEGAVTNEFTNISYVLPDGAKGVLDERPGSPRYNNGEFDAFVDNGNVLGVFYGHDHVNIYELEYKDIMLCNTPGAGFSSYNGMNNGVRTITLHEGDLSKFDTEVLIYVDMFKDDAQAMALFELYSDTTSTGEKILAFFKYAFSLIASFVPVK